MATLDWSQCPAVESIPGKVSGAWVFRGTRVPVSAIFENLKSSPIEEVLANFHVTRDQIQTVLDSRKSVGSSADAQQYGSHAFMHNDGPRSRDQSRCRVRKWMRESHADALQVRVTRMGKVIGTLVSDPPDLRHTLVSDLQKRTFRSNSRQAFGPAVAQWLGQLGSRVFAESSDVRSRTTGQ